MQMYVSLLLFPGCNKSKGRGKAFLYYQNNMYSLNKILHDHRYLYSVVRDIQLPVPGSPARAARV